MLESFDDPCEECGHRVGSIGLSPRGDWHMASDAWSDDFLEGLK